MALTNFAALTSEQKTAWSMDLWKHARNESFIAKFLGKGPNSLVQHVTELKKSEKGARAVMTLLADLEGDGIAGDRTLEGNEEAMKTYEQVIRIDQLRHANRSKGRISDQKSIVEFRSNSRDVLAYWLADRIDQMAFLTLAGRSYAYKPNGTTRVGSDLQNLEFASDVTAPSTNRAMRWDTSTGLELVAAGSENALGDADVPKWDTFLELKKYAKENYIRGVKNGGDEVYHAFLTPMAMMLLKQDDTFKQNVRYAQSRGSDNPLFTGSSVLIDGIMLHEFRHVPAWSSTSADFGMNTALTNGAGSHILFCGAQALGMADIGNPEWVEKDFDYDNQHGISVSKMLGFLKPRFYNPVTATTEDFGVINCLVSHN